MQNHKSLESSIVQSTSTTSHSPWSQVVEQHTRPQRSQVRDERTTHDQIPQHHQAIQNHDQNLQGLKHPGHQTVPQNFYKTSPYNALDNLNHNPSATNSTFDMQQFMAQMGRHSHGGQQHHENPGHHQNPGRHENPWDHQHHQNPWDHQHNHHRNPWDQNPWDRNPWDRNPWDQNPWDRNPWDRNPWDQNQSQSMQELLREVLQSTQALMRVLDAILQKDPYDYNPNPNPNPFPNPNPYPDPFEYTQQNNPYLQMQQQQYMPQMQQQQCMPRMQQQHHHCHGRHCR